MSKLNRYQLEQTLAGIGQNLKAETEKLTSMYADSKTTLDARSEQKNVVKDLEERHNGIKSQIAELDAAAQAKLQAKSSIDNIKDDKSKIITAKASLIRSVMARKPVADDIKNILGGVKAAALGDGSTLGNGDKILPSTLTNELLTEPVVTNPLRDISTMTNITNLEVPKIIFSLDDDNFIADGATAKELAASADTIVFGRNKFKVFCDITETVLNGTDTNLVATVNAGLQSGLAKKEKKVAFEATTPTDMSFYQKTGENYAIKAVSGSTMYDAITQALADLEDDYGQNAKIVMRKADYFAMIKDLANGSATLFMAQPEQILGAPVVFCDLATVPIIGDFAYSHFNYDLNMLYDQDKNVKTGIESFVLTAWLDHKIKMYSAFRLATVTP
ncbi:MAG: phage major capsid protein [Bacillota bacterium]|nr:phage major capsid protein [Bacillota bacterium]